MEYIEEFVALELIIAFDYEDLPEYYVNLLKQYKGKKPTATNIRIIHWEWKHNNIYDLIIDIVFSPGEKEYGIICHDNNIIYHNNKQKLKVIDNFLENRLSSFEHVRKVDHYHEDHPHCLAVYKDVEEMKNELMEEDVSEEEYLALEKPYVHQPLTSIDISDGEISSDDVSSVSE